MTKLFPFTQIATEPTSNNQPQANKKTRNTFRVLLVKSIKMLIFLIFTLTIPTQMVLGQSVIDYRSKATGDWTTSGTWEFYNGSSWVALGTTLSTDNNAFTTDPSWTNVQISSGLNWIWGSASGNGNGGMSYTNPMNTTSNGTWYYKSITLTGGVTYSLTFDYKTSNVTATNSRIIVDISANIPTASTTWTGATELYNAMQATSGAWVNNTGTLSFTATTTGTYYLGFRNAYASAGAVITSSIDNITITGTCGIPSSTSGAIAIQSPHIVTVSSDLTVDQVTINSGGTVLLSEGTLSINNGADADDFIIKGTYKRTALSTTIAGTGTVYCDNGGIYEHAINGGTIPTITWSTGSTLKFTGVTSTMPTATGTYQNVVWNCTTQSAALGLENNLNSINGSFTVQSTNSNVLYLGNLGATPRTMSIGGNLNMEGGIFAIRAGGFNTSLHTINVVGNYNQTGGNFQLSRTTAGTNIPILNVAGDFTCSGGTLDNNAGANTLSSINFTKSGTQLFTLGGTIANGIEFNVKSGSILEFATATTVLSNSSVNSKFTVESGGGMIIKHAQGISTTASTGCINIGAPTAANYILNTAGNYTFNGSAPQVTGNKFPATVNNFTISNSSGATLTGVLTVNGTLNLSSGNFTSGASNLLTIGSSGTISNASASSYVNGNLARVITGTSATLFPVGKGGNYRPVTFTYTAAPTSKTVTIEQFESGLLSYANTSTARFGARYWNITQSATGIGYSIGLNNSGFTPTGTVVMLRREGTGAVTSNATSFISPTYTNSSSFSTGNVSSDVQLGETSIPLTISSAAATSKIYDKTNTAAITGTLTGVVSPDVVTLNGTGTFVSVDVATGISVSSTSSLAGANASAYTLIQPTGLTANITACPLTITGAANSKPFDGNTSSATYPIITSGTLYSGDVAAFTQVYDNPSVGVSKVLTPSGIVTDGNNGNNYSYSFITSNNGTINAASSITWNGSSSSEWNTPANWSPPMVPVAASDVVITNTGNQPVISTAGNVCTGLSISAGRIVTIASNGNLTVNGLLTNNAGVNGLVVESGGSLIETTPGVKGTVKRDISANEWHLISSPVSGATADMFYGYYLQRHSEPDKMYFDVTEQTDPLSPSKGYALYGNTGLPAAVFSGQLNAGSFGEADNLSRSGAPTSETEDDYGWNLMGNPYPSSIDWLASGWTKTNVENAIYIHRNSSTWATFVGGTGNNLGSQFIAPGQGFFVHLSNAGSPYPKHGTLAMTDAVRVHTTSPFFKSSDAIPNLIRLEVSGNSYKDETVVRFLPEATAEFDGDYDAYKLCGDLPEAAQIYSLGGTKLAINTLPETNIVPVGVKARVSGTYTIAATEINDLQYVTIEDTKTGIFTELAKSAYTFNFEAGENEMRFKLHFSALSIDEKKVTEANIYSYVKTVYINLADNVEGDIFICNIAGQMVATKLSAKGMNEIGMNTTGNYIVKVITKNNTTVKKVFIQ